MKKRNVKTMRVRTMTREDVEPVYKLSCESFSEPWSLESISKEVDNPVAIYKVAEEAGQVIAFGGMWQVIDEGEIINIAVQKDYQRQGIGQLILKQLIEESKARGIVLMHLEVRAGNTAAQQLYQKLGFKSIAVRKSYYHEPTEDAVIMQYSLN